MPRGVQRSQPDRHPKGAYVMSSKIKKLNRKLDKMANNAKDGTEEIAGKIIDAANDVAHSAAEKARQQTEKAGEKLIEAGEKIVKMAK
ncbi:MAG: hypothetical protein ACREN6_06265 [Gemmatimonadaceae bacterium]